MPRQLALADALNTAGLNVVEQDGWRERGNVGFNPKGLVVHHTAITSTEASARVVTNGRPDLAGPLSHIVLDPNGVVYLIASGRANHAGTGGWKWLTGNASVYGIEAVHSGKTGDPWPDGQLWALYRASAALAKLSGFTEDFVCGHKEWAPTRKIDPIDLDMHKFRIKVAEHIVALSKPKTIGAQYMPSIDISVVASVKLADGRVYLAQADGSLYGFEVPPIRGANGEFYFGGRQVANLWRNDAPMLPLYVRGKADGLGIVIQTTTNEYYGEYRA